MNTAINRIDYYREKYKELLVSPDEGNFHVASALIQEELDEYFHDVVYICNKIMIDSDYYCTVELGEVIRKIRAKPSLVEQMTPYQIMYNKAMIKLANCNGNKYDSK